MYICMECGYEWEDGMFPKTINCCPICGCGNIDEVIDIDNDEEQSVDEENR